MKKQYLFATFAALLLTIISCRKTDLNPEDTTLNSDFANTHAKLQNAITSNNNCDVISFEGVPSGTLLSSVTSEGGVVVPMTSSNSSSPGEPIAAIVFDSDVPHSEDIDLGTPSVLFGGPGNVDHRQSTAGLASNNTELHNIVVIQNFTDYGTRPLQPNDDDNRDRVNESMTFSFQNVGTVTAQSITVIDVEKQEEGESGWVILYNASGGEITRFAFPETWESGVQVINFGNIPNVASIKLDINGSIGFDNLRFCAPPPPCDVISFEGVPSGTLLSSVTSEGGVVVPMTSSNSSSPGEPIAAIVFDSDVPHSEDIDLGTPSVLFGGPGNVDHRQSTAGLASNNTELHNIVVIQNFTDYGTRPLQPNDDDNRDRVNESMTFSFQNVGTVTAQSITVIDVEKQEEGESGWVILYNASGGEITRFAFPETWESGVQVINLGNTPGVASIKLDINGSIGFDNLRFCVDNTPPPPPPPTGCTKTQGFWKTHGPTPKGNNKNEWNVTQLTLGTRTYSAAKLLEILNTPPKKGNGLVSLAHQLIAAKLNIANGADPSAIASTIAAADKLIGSLKIPPTGNDFLSSSVTSKLNDMLTRYNEGLIGPGHCDD